MDNYYFFNSLSFYYSMDVMIVISVGIISVIWWNWHFRELTVWPEHSSTSNPWFISTKRTVNSHLFNSIDLEWVLIFSPKDLLDDSAFEKSVFWTFISWSLYSNISHFSSFLKLFTLILMGKNYKNEIYFNISSKK